MSENSNFQKCIKHYLFVSSILSHKRLTLWVAKVRGPHEGAVQEVTRPNALAGEGSPEFLLAIHGPSDYH